MEEVFQEAVNQLEQGEPMVVATVIRTKGSTPQKPGAKLLVRRDGSGVGTLGGGCVEGDIWFAANELMKRGGPPEHRDYQLNEELAAQDGLVCGGTMYFLIDPVYTPGDYLTYATEIDRAYQGGPGVAVATLIKAGDGGRGATGQKLFIRDYGPTEGTLGSDTLDDDAIERARGLMAHGRSEYVIAEDGTEYFVEAYTTPPQLVLCGGGHVSKAIAPLAKSLGFLVYVTDDREEFANPSGSPKPRGWSRRSRSRRSRRCRSTPTPSSSSPRGATDTTTSRWRRRSPRRPATSGCWAASARLSSYTRTWCAAASP